MAKKICLGCMEQYEDEMNVCPYCGYVEGTKPKEAYQLHPGVVLQGKYIVGKAIGYGGFGVTYIGYDYALGHKIAIKEYLPGECSTRCEGSVDVTIFEGEKGKQFERGIEKFADEARRLAELRNIKNIVTVYDSFKENNTAYIVMEYLEGKTLKEIIKEEGKMNYEKAIAFIVPILDALTEVHKSGLIHRDISPDNIFITKDGGVKLIDFGAARYAATDNKSLSIIVKAGYAPPEQYRSRGDQGGWTDVYACAATLYTLLTGVVPVESMNRIKNDTLVPPRKLGSDIPKKKQNALKNAMNLKVEDRTRTADEFKRELLSESFVKRKKDTLKGLDIGDWPTWLKVTIGTAFLAIIVFIALLSTGVISFKRDVVDNSGVSSDGKVTVPNIVNLEYGKAMSALKNTGLKMKVSGKVSSADIPKNYILSQDIAAGSMVDDGTTINVTMSSGGDSVFIEDMIGFKLEDVTKKLDEAGVMYYSPEESEEVIAPGYVCYQSIAEGNSVEKGSQIKLKVSKGKAQYDSSKKTTVPTLTGLDFDEGKKLVKDANLYICKINAEYSDTLPKGQIISQELLNVTDKNAKEVNEGSIIGVKVSLGIRKVRIPDLEFMKKDEAVKKLEDLGLKAKVVEEDSETVEKGLVIRQSIAADEETEVSKDGKTVEVTITVSRGITGLVPGLVGLEQSVAEESIKSSGFTVGSISYKDTDSKADDMKVASQNPSADSKADKGSKIDLTVYRYKTTIEDTVTESTTEETTTEAQVISHEWSAWQEQAIDATDSIEVETKTQYSFRKNTVKEEYSEWSAWSEWLPIIDGGYDPSKDDTINPDTMEYEIKQSNYVGIFSIVISGEYYPYTSLSYDMIDLMKNNWVDSEVIELAIEFIDEGRSYDISDFIYQIQDMGYSAELYDDYIYADGDINIGNVIYSDNGTPGVVTDVIEILRFFRYRTRNYKKTVIYGMWSDFSDEYVAETNDTEVRTRVLYRWRNK